MSQGQQDCLGGMSVCFLSIVLARFRFHTPSHISEGSHSLQAACITRPVHHLTHFSPEGGDSRFLHKVSILLGLYLVSQPTNYVNIKVLYALYAVPVPCGL
jgi:hypothetical protein